MGVAENLLRPFQVLHPPNQLNPQAHPVLPTLPNLPTGGNYNYLLGRVNTTLDFSNPYVKRDCADLPAVIAADFPTQICPTCPSAHCPITRRIVARTPSESLTAPTRAEFCSDGRRTGQQWFPVGNFARFPSLHHRSQPNKRSLPQPGWADGCDCEDKTPWRTPGRERTSAHVRMLDFPGRRAPDA